MRLASCTRRPSALRSMSTTVRARTPSAKQQALNEAVRKQFKAPRRTVLAPVQNQPSGEPAPAPAVHDDAAEEAPRALSPMPAEREGALPTGASARRANVARKPPAVVSLAFSHQLTHDALRSRRGSISRDLHARGSRGAGAGAGKRACCSLQRSRLPAFVGFWPVRLGFAAPPALAALPPELAASLVPAQAPSLAEFQAQLAAAHAAVAEAQKGCVFLAGSCWNAWRTGPLHTATLTGSARRQQRRAE